MTGVQTCALPIYYQFENKKYIPDAGEAIHLLRLVYISYITNAEIAQANLDSYAAQDLLQRAKALCERHLFLDCKSNIYGVEKGDSKERE